MHLQLNYIYIKNYSLYILRIELYTSVSNQVRMLTLVLSRKNIQIIRKYKFLQKPIESCEWVFSNGKPLAVHQACSEALCEGLDPVVSQHHSLRQAEVELLL